MSEEEKNVIKDFLELREIHSNNSMSASYLSIYQNAVRKMLSLLDEKQKEIEEKTTIIMAGAEKVKQLEKEIEEYQKCFEDIERHQKNQMQMQKNLWKILKGEKNNE